MTDETPHDPDHDPGAEALGHHARAIRDWQLARPTRMSDEALIRRYPSLGSTKTYKRILAGDTEELRAGEWAVRYRAVLAQIDAEEAEASRREEVYDDLEPACAVRTAVASVVRSIGIERLVLIEGDTGSGKTSALSVVASLYPAVRLDASVGWRSFATAMGDLAVAVGVADEAGKLPVSGAARLEAIARHLGEARRLILIDEGHHLTADCLNALKHLINATQARFVVAAQNTLWRKLAAASQQEADQLLKNRLRARVHLAGPSQADAAAYVAKRCGLALESVAAAEVARTAAAHGRYAFLRRLANALLESRRDADEATALELSRNLAAQLS